MDQSSSSPSLSTIKKLDVELHKKDVSLVKKIYHSKNREISENEKEILYHSCVFLSGSKYLQASRVKKLSSLHSQEVQRLIMEPPQGSRQNYHREFGRFLKSKFCRTMVCDTIWLQRNRIGKIPKGYIRMMEVNAWNIESFTLLEFVLHTKQLKRIFYACRNATFAKFERWQFIVPKVPDFSKVLEGTRIYRLTLFGFAEEPENVEEQLISFKNLFEGLATSECLKESWEDIDIFGWIGRRLNLTQVFADLGFERAYVNG